MYAQHLCIVAKMTNSHTLSNSNRVMGTSRLKAMENRDTLSGTGSNI